MPKQARRKLPPIVPNPRRLRQSDGQFVLRTGLPLVLSPDAYAADARAARALRDAVQEICGVSLAIEGHTHSADLGPRIEMYRQKQADGDAQRYRLCVTPERIEIEAGSAIGLRYAVETLRQLIDPRGRVPCLEIDDAPELRRRGLMLDISRGRVPTAETLRELVDLCVRLKLNVLMLYTEHTFRFRRHPEIGAANSPLDAQTLRDLDEYAAERHVELVPCLQTLGHMHEVLRLPRYRALAETDDCWTISPSEPGSYELLRDLIEEYLPNFHSSLFNANCDEPFDLGQGRSRERAQRDGRASLYLNHVRRIRDVARNLGKRTMIWGDVVHQHPERIPEIDRELLMLDWWYEAEGDFDRVKIFAENKIEFWVCPGTSTWNALLPRTETMLGNVTKYTAAAKRHGAGGLLLTDWGDHGHYNPLGQSLFAYAFAAQQAWSGEMPAADFDAATSRVLFGDRSGRAARSYRELGSLQDAGFPVVNGSGLQWIFFDDVGPAQFLVAAKAPALRGTQKKLERAAKRLTEMRSQFGDDKLTHDELSLGCEGALLATRKGLAGLEWLAWRRNPKQLDARARRKLARELEAVAREQSHWGKKLQRQWLARSRPGGFEITQARLQGSLRSLRKAARALVQNRVPKEAAAESYDFGSAYKAVVAQVKAATPTDVAAPSRKKPSR